MNRIKQLREEKGITQSELGKVLNVEHSAISKYEKEIVPLQDSTIKKLCEYFDVSSDYLLGRSEVRNYKNVIKEVERKINTDPLYANLEKLSGEKRKIIDELVKTWLNE